MCGIAGVLSPRIIDRERMELAASSLRHRGPDDHGVSIRNFARGQLGLVNTRLAILDLSLRGHQPMVDESTGNEIVFNGEIYNARALREELRSFGAQFAGSSDTEVVLKGFGAWGAGAFARLRGMFALAIHDATNKKLVIARDPIGIKPLYWSNDTDELCFASELRTLMELRGGEAELNSVAIGSYLSAGCVSESSGTVWKSVFMAPPGTYTEISEGREVTWKRYATLQVERFRGSYADAVSATRSALAEACARHMLSDVPVALFLSGGLDSTAVTALLTEQGFGLRTFSLVFAEERYSEALYSREVAHALQTEHTQVELSVQDALSAVPEFLKALDQPSVDGLNTFLISREAHRAGLKVALSGLGGDELFGGYPGFKLVERGRRTLRHVPGRAGDAISALVRLLPRTHRTAKFSAALRTRGDLTSLYALSRELFDAEWVEQLGARSAEVIAECAEDAFGQVSLLELRNYTLNMLLRDNDVVSMASSLELRVPLLDTDLVALALSLPAEYKKRGGGVKPLLAAAVRELVPVSVLSRKKRGFELPFALWLKGAMRAEMEAVMLDSSAALHGMLSREAVKQVWESFLAGRTSWSRPWALYVLLRWHALARTSTALAIRG